MAGIGTVKGWLDNEASYYPGFEDLVGTMTIEDYFENSGVLFADIAGAASNDLVDIAAYATLGGMLDVTLHNNFVPDPWTAVGSPGDSFTILSAEGSLEGEFAGHNLPDVSTLDLPPLTAEGQGYEWVIVYDRDDATPEPLLVHTHPSFASQPWLGNGTQDVVLVIREIPFETGAFGDEYQVSSNEGGSLQVAAPGVLENDYHADAAAVVPQTGPYHGSLTFGGDGSFTYTPTPGYSGLDSFDYVAVNTLRGVQSEPVSVTFTVEYLPPTALDDFYEATSNLGDFLEVLPTGVMANDSHADSAELVPATGPSHGSLTFNPDGSFVYTPTTGYSGEDTFQYIVIDSWTGNESPPATVTITVTTGSSGGGLTLAAPPAATGGAALQDEQLAPLARAAVARWRAAGLDEETLQARLADLHFVIRDLPGALLARALGDGTVQVDVDAAGHGWFVDPSPQDDAEFQHMVSDSQRQATGDSAAVDRADLLTTVMHEIGHLLELDHHPSDTTNIMAETLPLGTRRLPTALDAAAADYLFYQWRAGQRRAA